MKRITDKKILDSIIEKSLVCHLAMCDGNTPYILPMSFGYDGSSLYFHSSPAGRKIDILKKNNRVCFEFNTDVKIVKGDTACDWNMKSESVIGTGTASFIEDEESKREALDVIKAKYSAQKYGYKPDLIGRIAVIKVKIEEISARVSD